MIIMIFIHIQSIFYLHSDFHSNPSWRNQMEPLDSKASGVARYHISGLTPHVVSATTTTRGESVSKERIMAAEPRRSRKRGPENDRSEAKSWAAVEETGHESWALNLSRQKWVWLKFWCSQATDCREESGFWSIASSPHMICFASTSWSDFKCNLPTPIMRYDAMFPHAVLIFPAKTRRVFVLGPWRCQKSVAFPIQNTASQHRGWPGTAPWNFHQHQLLGGFNHLEIYEFVNGKDDIPYVMENKIHVPNHQPAKKLTELHPLCTSPEAISRAIERKQRILDTQKKIKRVSKPRPGR